MIEIGRYKNLETEERLCKLCITQKIEDEYNFLIDCPIYNNSRKICYQKISGPTIGANKLHTLIIVIGGNYTYIYKYNVSCRVQSIKK
jgi:hypothetical protein